MKIQNGELYHVIKPALEKLIQVPMPVKTSFRVARFSTKINVLLADIQNVINALVLRYGSPDKRTGKPTVQPDNKNYPEFIREYDELMDIEVEVPDEQIVLPASINIEASVLLGLEKFLVME